MMKKGTPRIEICAEPCQYKGGCNRVCAKTPGHNSSHVCGRHYRTTPSTLNRYQLAALLKERDYYIQQNNLEFISAVEKDIQKVRAKMGDD